MEVKLKGDTVIIRKVNGEFLAVDPVPEGKMINYYTSTEQEASDLFSVGISWNSLEKLESRSKSRIFEWEIKDATLRVSSNNEKWDLHFTSLNTGLRASVILTEDETKKIKDALFKQ